MNYALNHRDTLMNYLKDGRCEISNNAAERRAKVYATGRKNFLFHDTEDGAKASAVVLRLEDCLVRVDGLLLIAYDRRDKRRKNRGKNRRKDLIDLICKKLIKGKSVEQIADDLEDTVENITIICEVANEFAPDYDIEENCMTLQKN